MTSDIPTSPGPRGARRLAWIYLALAVVIEVIGLTVMKAASTSGGISGHVVMYVAIALSYVCLAKAVKTLSVGVAYAIWEGSGIALITLVSVFFFHHDLSLREFVGLAMAVLGIVLVNAGEHHGTPRREVPMSVPELPFLLAVLAGLFDVAANLASSKSEGFARKGWGLLSIALVLVAFALLAEAVRGIDLAVAYAILGATGIFGTAISARFLFKQRLKPIGWVGLALVFGAVVVLQTG